MGAGRVRFSFDGCALEAQRGMTIGGALLVWAAVPLSPSILITG
jgi:hypothetical protein